MEISFVRGTANVPFVKSMVKISFGVYFDYSMFLVRVAVQIANEPRSQGFFCGVYAGICGHVLPGPFLPESLDECWERGMSVA